MKNKKLTITLIMTAILSAATALTSLPHRGLAVQAPDPVVDSSDVSKGRIQYVPPEKHHFNTDAPNRAWLVGEGAAESKTPLRLQMTEKKAEIALPPAEGASREAKVRADLFLCDDAKTFCVKKTMLQTVQLPAATSAKKGKAKVSTPSLKPEKKKSSSRGSTDPETGFILNDPDLAFRKARELGRPLLIDFYGIWCPPCNHLDAMVLKTPEFRRKTGSKFVTLKLDSDSEISAKLKARYSIRGLPTLLFTTSTGDEIVRVAGFRPLEEILKVSESAYASRSRGFEALVQASKKGDAVAAARAARIALDRGDAKSAIELVGLAVGSDGKPRATSPALTTILYTAKVKEAQDGDDAQAQEKALRAAIAGIPDIAENWEHYDSLAQLLEDTGRKDEARAILRQGSAALSALREKVRSTGGRVLSEVDLNEADIEQLLGDFQERSGEMDQARASYLRCADLQLKRGEAEKSPFPRGPRLEQAYCLKKAGESARAEAILREGVKRYPGEYTFRAQLASLLFETPGKAEEALAEVRLAMKSAYGGQRIKGALLESKILEKSGKISEAIQTLDRELSSLPEDQDMPGRDVARKRILKRKSELAAKI